MALPPARRREIAEIEKIYQAAFIALGIKTLAEGLDLHGELPTSPAPAAAAVTRFIDQVLKVAGLRRQHAYKITLPYYRLVRALWTGYTIQEIEVTAAGTIHEVVEEATEEALSDLRNDFYRQVEALTPEAMSKRPSGSGDYQVKIDKIKNLEKKLDDLDKFLDQWARTDLVGVNAKLIKDLHEVDRELSASEVDQISEDHKQKAGAKSAAVVEKSALDASRKAAEVIAMEDPKAIGFVRIHSNPVDTPCGWCAMLLSRGFKFAYGGIRLEPKTLYNSESAASKGNAADGRYHLRCHCRTIPVYDAEDALKDPALALNRQYAEEWPAVTAGLGGKPALSKWRKHIRDANK